jgi:tripartite-type tricarboxylate transporter receptor subunit TctC
MHPSRRRVVGAALAAAAVATGRGAQAQGGRPIALVVPYAPGGGTDIAAREFAALLSAELGGQPVVVDNRAGAAGHIGSVAVARARPDGGTLLFAVNSNIVINPHMQRSDRVDLANVLVPVIQTSAYQYVLVADPRLGTPRVDAFIALARARELTFSSSGVGGNNHLAGVLFAEAAGIRMEHVPYRGTAPALMDVVAGNVALNVSSPPPAIPLVREGRLHAIAVTGPRRVAALPDVPTLSEAVRPGLVIEGWHGLFAPPGAPAEMLDRLEAAARRAVATARFQERLAHEGLDPAPARPRAEFAGMVRAESAFWAGKIRELDLRLD